jgi:hypothetical protein
VLRAERSSYHYRGCRTDQADLKKRIREIAETPVRYGSTYCSVVKAGRSTAGGFIAFTRRWDCNCARKRPDGE